MGILINYVLLHLIQGFRREQLQRLRQLEQDKIAVRRAESWDWKFMTALSNSSMPPA